MLLATASTVRADHRRGTMDYRRQGGSHDDDILSSAVSTSHVQLQDPRRLSSQPGKNPSPPLRMNNNTGLKRFLL